jgi:hypothetical protein
VFQYCAFNGPSLIKKSLQLVPLIRLELGAATEG